MTERADWGELDQDQQYTRRRGPVLLLTVLSSAPLLLMFAYVGYAVFA